MMISPLYDVPPHLRGFASFWLDAIVEAAWSPVVTSSAGDDKNATALEAMAHAGWIDLTILRCGDNAVCRIAPAEKWMNTADPLVPY